MKIFVNVLCIFHLACKMKIFTETKKKTNSAGGNLTEPKEKSIILRGTDRLLLLGYQKKFSFNEKM